MLDQEGLGTPRQETASVVLARTFPESFSPARAKTWSSSQLDKCAGHRIVQSDTDVRKACRMFRDHKPAWPYSLQRHVHVMRYASVFFLFLYIMAQVEPTAPHCLIHGEENTSKRKHEVINSAENSMIGPKSEPDQFLYVATQREGEERQNELVCGR